jgi:uncharacterized membrane protein
MDIAAVPAWLEASTVATAIRNSLYLFPLIESFHVLGVSIVVGTVLVIDLRLLGLASSRRPFTLIASDIFRWTWMAFALAALTGALMFATNATSYYVNTAFRTKMVMLVLAGLNMAVFELTARRSVGDWDRDTAAPAAGRRVAILSLAIWIVVVFLGRWVGFTLSTTAAPANEEINLEELENLIPK